MAQTPAPHPHADEHKPLAANEIGDFLMWLFNQPHFYSQLHEWRRAKAAHDPTATLTKT
jgi:hypothetical protein